MSTLELWGGHECTVNRVGDRYHDQTLASGHQSRIEDLDRFAELGVSALRYPVLWERTAPDDPQALDFGWSDERLARMAALGLRPIVGLLHHGSGPRYTSLVDPRFPSLFADFAAKAAERYAEVLDWTPVNEPLTTARFSALYGHWYPHAADERSFWLALLNQIDATRLAMREIRRVQPAARLIQTEDLGRTYSTRVLQPQADFDNQRRWLTWDLLTGAVTRDHPMHARIAAFGFADRLAAIADDPCPPDVLGVNHYLTSERFLDHRCERYPADRVGGNGQVAYADVEAVRVLSPAPDGLAGVLDEAWARYGRTIAVTEAHNGCTREEQVRWLGDAWETARSLRAKGVDVAAVTAWALLGAYDWNSLLTRLDGHYESGAFDLRGGRPRPTAVAQALKALSAEADPHPTASGPGWWRRDIRLAYQPVFRSIDTPIPFGHWRAPARSASPVLITGATGTLGRALARACQWRGVDYVLTDRRRLDLADDRAIAGVLDEVRPWAVINAAGWVRVDEAEQAEAACHAANADGAARLAAACAERDLGFLTFSSDLVFDGALGRAYHEGDACAPLNAYGRSKRAAEERVLAIGGKSLVVRAAAFFSPFDPHNFAMQTQRALAAGAPVVAAEDLVVSPTYTPDLADAALDLAIDGETGLWHLANQGAVSWAEFARRIATAFSLPQDLVRPASAKSLGLAARRPAFAPLTSERGLLLPTFDDAVARHAAAWRAAAFETHAPAIAADSRLVAADEALRPRPRRRPRPSSLGGLVAV